MIRRQYNITPGDFQKKSCFFLKKIRRKAVPVFASLIPEQYSTVERRENMNSSFAEKIWKLFRSWAGEYLPMGCPLCGGEPFDGESGNFCGECLQKLPFVKEPFCPKCGGHHSGILQECSDCIASPETLPWDRGISVFRMEGPAREMIHRYKYRNQVELIRPLGKLAAQRLMDSGLKVDLIVPTPLHFFRYLSRSYNQADLLSRELSRHTSIPVENLLRRKKWTKKQATLSRIERKENLSDAFSIRDSTKCKSRCILLVDDVMTTGSTLSAGARTLLEGGASQVHILVLARRQRN